MTQQVYKVAIDSRSKRPTLYAVDAKLSAKTARLAERLSAWNYGAVVPRDNVHLTPEAAILAAAGRSYAVTFYGAHHPRDAGNAAGRDHLVTSVDLSLGRLNRRANSGGYTRPRNANPRVKSVWRSQPVTHCSACLRPPNRTSTISSQMEAAHELLPTQNPR